MTLSGRKVAAAVVGRTVRPAVLGEQLRASTSRKTWKHAVFESDDQIDASASGGDCAVEIDISRMNCAATAGRVPIGAQHGGAVHAAEARLISEHDAQASTAPGSGPPGFSHSIRKAVFLKAFCAAKSRWGEMDAHQFAPTVSVQQAVNRAVLVGARSLS